MQELIKFDGLPLHVSMRTLSVSHSNHSRTDMQLIPLVLQKIHSSRDSVRNARESQP